MQTPDPKTSFFAYMGSSSWGRWILVWLGTVATIALVLTAMTAADIVDRTSATRLGIAAAIGLLLARFIYRLAWWRHHRRK